MENSQLLNSPEPVSNISETSTNSQNVEPHPLSENALFIFNVPEEKEHPPKPPSSPRELITDCYISVLPKIPENISDLEIPFVRQVGVRDSIETLAPFFSCEDYRSNLVEFWFLDVIVDCIWKVQDEYRFPAEQQKCILEWVLFIIELIISKNMTKELMFRIVNEAMTIAEEYIQAGGPKDPVPRNLFTLTLENDSETPESISSLDTSLLTKSLSSVTILRSSKQYIVVECNQEYKVFKLPTREPNVDCLSSSVDSASDDDELSSEETLQPTIANESESSVDFCKVDMSTPPRFKSLQDFNEPTSTDSSIYGVTENQESDNVAIGDWHKVITKSTPPVCPSKIIVERASSTVMEEHKNQIESSPGHTPDSNNEITPTKDEIFKAFYEYNVWNLKNELMAEPNLGWTSLSSIRTVNEPTETEKAYNFDQSWKSEEAERERFIKSVLLLTVRQIVHDYFQHNFAFDLVKISLTTPQFFIAQDVNMDWYTPKEFKGDFKKPVPKKPKKEKAKKEPKTKPKKDKTKSSKGDKKSPRKKSEKKSKSDKKSKTSKKSKSSKEGKSKKLSKEEKKELERLKKEQEEEENELLRQAEEKIYMFPLKDAVDDQFFVNLFPNYKPVKKEKSGKKDKSSKGSQDSKNAKLSKGSKKSKKT